MSGSKSHLTLGDSEETEALGRRIGATLAGGELVLLTGDLGTGKTVLARGIGHAMGVSLWRGSPTFALIHEYRTRPRLIHGDLYRLQTREVEDLGWADMAEPGSTLVVEWADRADSYLRSLPHARIIEVHLDHSQGNKRLAWFLDQPADSLATC